jgi:hypothetical protein
VLEFKADLGSEIGSALDGLIRSVRLLVKSFSRLLVSETALLFVTGSSLESLDGLRLLYDFSHSPLSGNYQTTALQGKTMQPLTTFATCNTKTSAGSLVYSRLVQEPMVCDIIRTYACCRI